MLHGSSLQTLNLGTFDVASLHTILFRLLISDNFKTIKKE